jgi:hypothetical protein
MDLRLENLGEWKPISRLGAGAWLVLYVLFLFYAWFNAPNFLFPDFVNLMIHEAGHPLFSFFGNTLMLLGGTLLELIVPAACAIYFFFQRQPYGVAFSSFWFFENFLYIGTYMADARMDSLPLVGSETSDWLLLFGQWDLLLYDQKIGHTFRFLGWLGMLATIVWLVYRTYRSAQPHLKPLEL